MADCTGCKWRMGFDFKCLLGRSPERCNNNPARRGDDELADRLLDLPAGDQEELKRRLNGAGDNAQALGSEEGAAEDPGAE